MLHFSLNQNMDAISLLKEKQEMKDDNSCLFRSIAYVLEKNAERYLKLRRIIADQIQARPNEFPEVVLGRAPDAYCSWIQTPGAWGGAIELSIFSEYFQAGEFSYMM